MTTMEHRAGSDVSVWDVAVRVVHWALVLCLAILFVSINVGWMAVHFYAGYTLTALILFRLLWALVGTTYARFSGFHFSLTGLARQCRAMVRGQPIPSVGHNPAGSVMVVVLWTVLLLQGISGLFFSDDVFWYGPFSFSAPDWVLAFAETLHPALPSLTLVLVGAHVLAVVYHQVWLKEPLVNAMIHGRKPVVDPTQSRSRTSVPWLVISVVPATGWLVWLLSFPV